MLKECLIYNRPKEKEDKEMENKEQTKKKERKTPIQQAVMQAPVQQQQQPVYMNVSQQIAQSPTMIRYVNGQSNPVQVGFIPISPMQVPGQPTMLPVISDNKPTEEQRMKKESIIQQAETLLANNNNIISEIERKGVNESHAEITQFAKNTKSMLSLTDKIANPTKLPFLSLMLDLPPEMLQQQ